MYRARLASCFWRRLDDEHRELGQISGGSGRGGAADCGFPAILLECGRDKDWGGQRGGFEPAVPFAVMKARVIAALAHRESAREFPQAKAGIFRCCNAKSRHTQLSEKSRLGRSACPGNEPGNACVHNRIEPDSCTDLFTNFLDRVIGKSRDIKIFFDVADARSCGKRSRAALQRPG